jgi:tetratricopeptide (TPR) repeat protein
LGKDDALALCFGGFGLAYVVGDLDDGAAMTDRALVVNPNLAVAWLCSGWVRTFRGEPEMAISHLARAMRLSPLDPITFQMQFATALAHFSARRYDEAASWAERSLGERFYGPTLTLFAASSALAGRLEEAHTAIARRHQGEPALLRISDLKDRLPFRRPDDLARYEDGLRKAGLPE